MTSEDLDERIAELQTLRRGKLLQEWERLWKRTPPKYISRVLLIRSIAYKLQEQIYGGLSPTCQKALNTLIKSAHKPKSRPIQSRGNIRSGTRLIREWKGELHEVIVSTDGYIHKGKTYKSLSQIAREITGSRWNGPAFFGLRPAKKS